MPPPGALTAAAPIVARSEEVGRSPNMSTTFRLNADELEPSFVEKIKTLFAHKDIAVTIYEEDETDRIRANPDLHRRLLEAAERVDRREGLVDVDLDSLN